MLGVAQALNIPHLLVMHTYIPTMMQFCWQIQQTLHVVLTQLPLVHS